LRTKYDNLYRQPELLERLATQLVFNFKQTLVTVTYKMAESYKLERIEEKVKELFTLAIFYAVGVILTSIN